MLIRLFGSDTYLTVVQLLHLPYHHKNKTF